MNPGHRPRAKSKPSKGRGPSAPLPVIGLEAEFTVYVCDRRRLPEHVFRNPRAIVRRRIIPRAGASCHLPSGGALYFDTGVIEVATPIIDIGPECCLRAVRSLWDQIEFVRGELDAWERRRGERVCLQGFSSHYNVSTHGQPGLSVPAARRLSRLLAYILPVPLMLLAANRRSTGIGVRARAGRMEVTADFTPDPELAAAAVAFATGVILEVMRWRDAGHTALAGRGIPVIRGYHPRRHTTRAGWLGRFDCYPANPFTADPSAPLWTVRDGRVLSLRQIAAEIARPFAPAILAVSSPATLRHVRAVFAGRARSLLDFPERPPRYDDVGRVVDRNRRSVRSLPRSRYERVIHRVLTHRPLRIGDALYRVERMQGWYEIVFRDTRTGRRRVFNLDEVAAALPG